MIVSRSEGTTESIGSFESNRRSIRVERFEPAGGDCLPVVLLLRGAEGLTYTSDRYRELAREFARHGYLVLLVHYLGGDGGGRSAWPLNPLKFLGWMHVIADGIEHAATQQRADPGRIALMGVSLGAYLALAVASQDVRVRAVVECCGGLPDILAHALTRMPPTLILHGDADPIVPVSEARNLERVLREKGLAHEVKIYPCLGHGFVGAESHDAFQRALGFLDRFLKV